MIFILGYSVHFSFHLVIHGFDFGCAQTFLTSISCHFIPNLKAEVILKGVKVLLVLIRVGFMSSLRTLHSFIMLL